MWHLKESNACLVNEKLCDQSDGGNGEGVKQLTYLILVVHKVLEIFDDTTLNHFILVLLKDAEFLEKCNYKDQKIFVLPVECLYQARYDVPLFHLELNIDVFRQIEENVEAYIQKFLLLVKHGIDFLNIRWGTVWFAEFALKFLISLLFIFHGFQYNGSNIVRHDNLMKLRKVGKAVKDIENIDDKVHAILAIIFENSRQRSEKRF